MSAITHDIHIFASSPMEMEKAQKALVQWATNRIAAVFQDIAEANENLATAKKNKWRHKPYESRVYRLKRKIVFYQKTREALKAGYYIIPPFPVDVFAIRTDRKKPNRRSDVTKSETSWSGHLQTPRLLPPGEGDYKSANPEIWRKDISYRDKDGNMVEQYDHYAKEFQDVDFPFTLVKPEVMTETARAMGMRVFDQLGVLPSGRTRGDPIVVGQIVHPEPYHDPMTFFVTWWLDTESI